MYYFILFFKYHLLLQVKIMTFLKKNKYYYIVNHYLNMNIVYGDYAKELVTNTNAFFKVHTFELGLIPFQFLIFWKIN